MENNNISYLNTKGIAKSFGVLPDGREAFSYSLVNDGGMEAVFTNYGATLISLKVPCADGHLADVVLGFESVQDYERCYNLPSAPYMGAVIGRYAGRLKKGKFRLNNEMIKVTQNHGEHTLHGGQNCFGQKLWEVKEAGNAPDPYIIFSYVSPDGSEGFPGALYVEVKYTLKHNNKLVVEYEAVTTKDTVINLTQHSYFNLDGHMGDVKSQKLQIDSHHILETTPDTVPTGLLLNVANCPFDFTTPHNCPEKIDTSYVLNENSIQPAASLQSEKTGLKMSITTNQPSVHIYVGGNCFGSIKGKEGAGYHALSGICFEAQNFPDAPNHENFPNAVLVKGETYYHKTIFKFENI